jgi:glucose/arabinose dehydrogenase
MSLALTDAWRQARKVLVTAFAVGALLASARVSVWLLASEPVTTGARRDWAKITGSASVERKLSLVLVGQGFKQITDIQFVPGATPRAIVLQKTGAAHVWSAPGPGQPVRPTQPGAQLLAVSVLTQSELGLLGLAFHPDFASNGLFYVNYNPASGPRRTRIAEWRLESVAALSGAAEQRVLLEVPQPYANHKAGALVFGSDRMLYIPLGDGGVAGDPDGHGQNPKSLLGKILRIDPTPSAGRPYGIPPGNLPSPQFRPEIWAYGLRNPWRVSFAPSGDLIVADVGQGAFEEIDLVRAKDNLGWNVREGGHCFPIERGCRSEGFVDPIFEYGRELGNSVTGGYVYAGNALPELRGKYVFADFGSGRLWALTLPEERGGAYATTQPLGQWEMQFSTFGRDAEGELYIADFYRGNIYRLAPR